MLEDRPVTRLNNMSVMHENITKVNTEEERVALTKV